MYLFMKLFAFICKGLWLHNSEILLYVLYSFAKSHDYMWFHRESHEKMKSRLTQKEAFEKEAGRQQKQNYFLDLKTSHEKNPTFSSCRTASKKHRDTFKLYSHPGLGLQQ